MAGQGRVARRSGAETRRAAQRIAFDLFTTQGYAATPLRQIADALGINKASLYHHFPSKAAILRSLFDERGSEAEQLREWLRAQPRTPDLLATGVARWVGSFSTDKLRGIRFVRANPLVAEVVGDGGDRIATALEALVDELVTLLPSPTAETTLLLRMSVLSINAAVEAAVGTGIPDEDVVRAATTAAAALIREIAPVGGAPR